MKHVALLLLLPCAAAAQGTAADYKRAAELPRLYGAAVPNGRVDAKWAADGESFGYTRTGADGKPEPVLVEAATGAKKTVKAEDLPKAAPAERPGPFRGRRSNSTSPDGKSQITMKDHNAVLIDRESKAETKLSTDGTAEHPYTGPVFWSPDSKKAVVMRTKLGGKRQVTLVESRPKDQLQPKTKTIEYLKPGDDIPLKKPTLFDIAAKKSISVKDDLFPNPWDVSYEHWAPDSKHFYFVYNQRGHRVVRLVGLDAETGAAKSVIEEDCKTFFDYAYKLYCAYRDAAGEVLWMTERSGWNHILRVDLATGAVKNAVTKGEWVVRGVERLDGDDLFIRTMGYFPGQDPYFVHYAKVKVDGTGFTPLTTADGLHEVQWSPDRKYYLATHSRLDLPPVTELRRTADGKVIAELERGDNTALVKAGWKPPERFVAKGRDDTTDVHGIIVRPTNFDPAKKYPVIESIYAGPQDHFVPKRFRPYLSEQGMAELGFIVVKIDGMGTNWRSKAFHDVCWKNLGDSGFPDRIKWIKEAAAKHPEMDIAKGVGIYGGSAGGQSTVRGMTEYPDFYTVGVADCGCHDNRMDKIWWNELWMSWPVGPHYAEQSNVTNAHKIKGKLLLVVGELDTNVDPASTLQVADALIKADKDFELMLVPGAGHGAAESPYGRKKRADFLVRNLLKVEPRR